jgi:putative membrane protein
MLDLVLILVLGIAAGVITGLVPGVHPNTVIFLLLPLYFLWQPPTMLFIAFAVGVSVVHTFVSFIPSVLLGAPDPETALSVLPGHKYLHHGRAYEAIQLTVHGGLVAAATALLALPLLFYGVPVLYAAAAEYMDIVLVALLCFMLWREPDWSHRMRAAGIIILAGLLGVITLNSPAVNTQYVLFPLFAGLFGASTIITALRHDSTIPPQRNSFPVSFRTATRGGVYGFLAAILAGFLPGLGAAQSAVLVQELRSLHLRDFVIALGGINTADLFLSLLALYVIGNPRSGAAVAVEQVSTTVTLRMISTVIGMAMVAVGAGALLARFLGYYVVQNVHRVPYPAVLKGTLLFIGISTVILTGVLGLVVFGTATALGMTAVRYNVRKSYCMAVLIVPTILFYAGIAAPL